MRTIANEITTFLSYASTFKNTNFDLAEPIPYSLTLNYKNTSKKTKIKTLTLMALTHGNETVGICVLNECLRLISEQIINPTCNINFILGNPKAALANKRFLDSDLNRLFGKENLQKSISRANQNDLKENYEKERVKEISPILLASDYFIDFHQTQRKTDRSFLLFPFNQHRFALISHLLPNANLLVYKEALHTQGLSSTNFTCNHDILGLTYELGEKGFDEYQVSQGLVLSMSIINLINNSKHPDFKTSLENFNGTLFTFFDSIEYPKVDFELMDKITNFYKIKKNEIIGTTDTNNIKSPCDGLVLFPKFPLKKDSDSSGVQRDSNDPLMRIIKEISKNELASF